MSTTLAPVVQASVDRWRVFLETSGQIVPEGLFAEDVFSDLTFPHWRLQTSDADSLVHVRQASHPQPGKVRVEKVSGDERGYSMKIEERWLDGGQDWYCREGFLCELNEAGEVTEFSLYCTGDWDEHRQAQHARTVALVRP
jgi:hypothetical protein